MFKLVSKSCIFKFSPKNPPALEVPSGATVEVETQDCFANQLRTPEDVLETLDWERINPATGPILVQGAEPGDALKVSIEKIAIGSQGVMASGKDMGVLGDLLEGLHSRLIPIQNNMAVFDPELKLPIKPMIGVIGVAPASGEINCGTPGSHGGNMDNTMMSEGATVYFPVFTAGALLALGDVHAVMGDGEIGVSGVEVPAVIRLRLEVVRDLRLDNPVLETPDYFTAIASAPTLDEAVNTATKDMAGLLSKRIPLSLAELAMLMSAAGHAQICQVVDPLRTARFVMPKWVLERYHFSF